MKKLLCLALAALMIFGLVGCTGNGLNTKGTTYAVSEELGADDAQLSEFFGGNVKDELSVYSPILFSFVTALYNYPEVLTQTPDSNFGWSYLYTMLAVYDLRPNGVSDKDGSIVVTGEALDQLQKDTLGGALWVAPGKDFADRVSYNALDQFFTCVDAEASPYSFEITNAVYNTETSCADVTINMLDTDGSVLGSYVIAMRASEESAYSYIISRFWAA